MSQEAGKGPDRGSLSEAERKGQGSQRVQGGNGQDAAAPGWARGRDPLPPVRKGGVRARAKRRRRGGRGRSKKTSKAQKPGPDIYRRRKKRKSER